MRRSALFVMAVLGVCLAFGLSAPSAQRLGVAHDPLGNSAGGPAATIGGPAPADPYGGPGGIGGIGPGFGGRGGFPVQFLGVTTQRFPLGVGALALSRACYEEHPYSRLCEWGDIFRAIPPVALDTEVLAAANYDTRPAPMCLNPNGGSRCNPSNLMRPAACCGYPPPQPPSPSPAFLMLTPSDPQSVTTCTDTFEFSARATDADGQPAEGVLISFIFMPVVGGTTNLFGNFNPVAAISNVNGEVSTILTLNDPTCEANCVGTDKDCSSQIKAQVYGSVESNLVTLVDDIP